MSIEMKRFDDLPVGAEFIGAYTGTHYRRTTEDWIVHTNAVEVGTDKERPWFFAPDVLVVVEQKRQ